LNGFSIEPKILTMIYHNVNKYPGWLSGVTKSLNLTSEEISFLEQLDDDFLWSRTVQENKQIAKIEKEMTRDYEWGILVAETDDQRIKILTQNITDAYSLYEESFKRDEPILNRMLILKLRDVEGMERLRQRLRIKTLGPIERESFRLTDYEIEKARDFPLEELVGPLAPGNKIICHWHDDSKPSMWIKNNYGWCFVCQTWTDSIKWQMEMGQMAFHEAVKYLCGKS